MQLSSMYEHCVRMKLLSQRFYMLKVTEEEFLCMKALVLFSISESARTASWKMAAQRWREWHCLWSGFVVAVPVEGSRSQRCFDELRTSYIKELDRLASHYGETTRRQRLFQLTQLLDYLQSVTDTVLPHTWNHDASINPTVSVILDRTTEHRCGWNKVSRVTGRFETVYSDYRSHISQTDLKSQDSQTVRWSCLLLKLYQHFFLFSLPGSNCSVKHLPKGHMISGKDLILDCG